ncbi:MAG: GTP-binding protein [Candidatus Micrarchaeota archaeon]
MGIQDKIGRIEEELKTTQKHKGTEYHIGLLKARLVRYKREVEVAASKGGSKAGFDVRKSGDSTVAIIGLPSVGKSTLLTKITHARSKTAAYDFTTVTIIPGILEYKGAKIQILDLPGIICGAAEGRGRGKEVLAVARSADLVLIVLDVFQPYQLDLIKHELEGIGVRLDKHPPDITLMKRSRGGLTINSTVKLTHLTEKMVQELLGVYGIHNGEILFRQDATVDELIDFLAGNRIYSPSLVVLNKVDLVDKKYLNALKEKIGSFIPISADSNLNIEAVKDAIYNNLEFIRIYTKPRFSEADLKEPLIIRKGTAVSDVCNRLHRDMRKNFKYALIWGPSAKFDGQKVGLDHKLADGDVVFIATK